MIILSHKYGQLGNRLSYLKDFFAISMEYNVSVIVFCFDEYDNFFTGTSRGFLCTFPNQTGFPFGRTLVSRSMHILLTAIGGLLSRIGCTTEMLFPEADKNGCLVFLGEGAENISKHRLILFLSGWPCVPVDIIEKHSEKIREYFSLVDEYAYKVKKVVSVAKSYGDFLVGIHIRQGDYEMWNEGKCYFQTDVYLKLMEKILQKHINRKVVFIICTNVEQNWSLFDRFTYVAGLGDAVVDMYSLAECDEIYGPQSSFSSWASFYGKVPLYGVQDLD